MLVALLLYAYARGNRSSRAIERACIEDVTFRVVTGNLAPGHSTIAEFRCRHEQPLMDEENLRSVLVGSLNGRSRAAPRRRRTTAAARPIF